MNVKIDRAAWLRGSTGRCELPVQIRVRPRRLVLLGAPGIGKGTQAELLSAQLGSCHLSTGDVFRAAKSSDDCMRSPALNIALDAMRRGELVSDETVLAIVPGTHRLPALRRRIPAGRLPAHRTTGRGVDPAPGAGTSPTRCRAQLRTASRNHRGAA